MTTDILRHETGAGTVLRVFFGATTEMPLRGLSYVTAATQIARHVPHEQLQVVFTNRLGEEVNGVDREAAVRQAMLIRGLGRSFIEGHHPDMADKIMFGEDVPDEMIQAIRPGVNEVISNDPRLLNELSGKDSKHGSDYETYAAAHVVYQDTDVMSPTGLTDHEPVAVTPERIVSIGCQLEHPFYRLRAQVREALRDLSYVPAAQVFTKHVLAPYYSARGGEQSLEDAMNMGVNNNRYTDPAARRDIAYLLTVMPNEEIQQ